MHWSVGSRSVHTFCFCARQRHSAVGEGNDRNQDVNNNGLLTKNIRFYEVCRLKGILCYNDSSEEHFSRHTRKVCRDRPCGDNTEEENFRSETCKNSYYCGDLLRSCFACGQDQAGNRFRSFYEKLLDGGAVSCDRGGSRLCGISGVLSEEDAQTCRAFGKAKEYIDGLMKLRESAKGKNLQNVIDLNLAAGYVESKQYGAAVMILESLPEEVIRNENLRVVYCINLCMSYFEIGKKEKARKVYEENRGLFEKLRSGKMYGESITKLDEMMNTN